MLAKSFVTPLRTTFIFGASQSELPIKSYGRLKFSHPKSMKAQIYGKCIQCKNSTCLPRASLPYFEQP